MHKGEVVDNGETQSTGQLMPAETIKNQLQHESNLA